MSQTPTTHTPNPGSAPILDLAAPHPVQRDYAAAATATVLHCAYCNAPLDPFFYFCLRCATPYKSALSLVGPARPKPMTDGERIKRLAPHTWTVFWTYAAVILICGLIALPFDGDGGPSPVAYFLATVAIFITTAIFTCIHWRPLAAQLKTSGFLRWETWAGVGLLIPLLLLNYTYHSLILHFMPDIKIASGKEIPLSLGIFIFCVFPAITEEIAFRGLVQYWLEVSIAPVSALLLGSAMFAGLHFSVISFPYLFLVGMLLATVRRRTGSLYPGMLIHFLHNLVAITCFGF